MSFTFLYYRENHIPSIEMTCELRDYDIYYQFVNTCVPHTLRNLYVLYKHFYVKGGKAADIYLKRKIGSPDWDIVFYITNTSDIGDINDHIIHVLNSFLINNFNTQGGASIISERNTYNEPGKPTEIMMQYGIKQGSCSNFFLDVVFVRGEFPGSTVIDGIPFQKREHLLNELGRVLTDRIKQVNDAAEISDFGYKTFEEIIDQKLKDNQQILDDELK